MDLTQNEKEMILLALGAEVRNLRTMQNELERRQLNMGNQNVEISRKVHETIALIKKISNAHSV